MTIYTKAALTTVEGICDGGIERTKATLAKLGLTMDSRVSMQLILRELGLSDTLFSFCSVCKGCEEEAAQVLGKYMAVVTGLACRFLQLTNAEYAEDLLAANDTLNKRFAGMDRKMLLAEHYKKFKIHHATDDMPQNKHFLNVYLIMLSSQPNHLCATHASIALMDGLEICGARREMHDRLYTELSDLLGDEHATDAVSN